MFIKHWELQFGAAEADASTLGQPLMRIGEADVFFSSDLELQEASGMGSQTWFRNICSGKTKGSEHMSRHLKKEASLTWQVHTVKCIIAQLSDRHIWCQCAAIYSSRTSN